MVSPLVLQVFLSMHVRRKTVPFKTNSEICRCLFQAWIKSQFNTSETKEWKPKWSLSLWKKQFTVQTTCWCINHPWCVDWQQCIMCERGFNYTSKQNSYANRHLKQLSNSKKYENIILRPHLLQTSFYSYSYIGQGYAGEIVTYTAVPATAPDHCSYNQDIMLLQLRIISLGSDGEEKGRGKQRGETAYQQKTVFTGVCCIHARNALPVYLSA